MIGIYKIQSPSGKIYIGQTRSFERRMVDYSYLSSTKCQTKLHNSFKKYGIIFHKFELIHSLPEDISQSVLDNYEQLYMDLYRDCGKELLNLKEGGYRGSHSEETKAKMRGPRSNYRGHRHSEETKTKMRGPRSNYIRVDNLNRKPILKLNFEGEVIQEYDYLMQACNHDQKLTGNVIKCLQNKRNSAYGFKWRYK